MNRLVLGGVTALLIVALLGAVPVTAQTVLLRATIPFDFFVGDKAMPAGDYAIQPGIGVSQTLKLWSADGKHAVYFATFAIETRGKGHADELVFKRYNDEYFLSSVWRADSHLGQAIPESGHEKVLRASSEAPVVKVLMANAR